VGTNTNFTLKNKLKDDVIMMSFNSKNNRFVVPAKQINTLFKMDATHVGLVQKTVKQFGVGDTFSVSDVLDQLTVNPPTPVGTLPTAKDVTSILLKRLRNHAAPVAGNKHSSQLTLFRRTA
jgi:hypothetical protein